MRPVSLADVEVAARVLICVPPDARAAVMADLLEAADTADRYRQSLRRRHPQFGSGTLMSAAQTHVKATRPAFLGNDMLGALACVINALRKNAPDQFS